MAGGEAPDGRPGDGPDTSTMVKAEIAAIQTQKVVSRTFGVPETVAPASTESGDYTYTDPDELAGVQTAWEDHLEELRKDQRAIAYAADLASLPVAEEGVSRHYAVQISTSLRSLMEHNQAMSDYANEYILKLKQARGLTVTNDQSAADSFGKNS